MAVQAVGCWAAMLSLATSNSRKPRDCWSSTMSFVVVRVVAGRASSAGTHVTTVMITGCHPGPWSGPRYG